MKIAFVLDKNLTVHRMSSMRMPDSVEYHQRLDELGLREQLGFA